MIALQNAVDVLMDLTIGLVHSRASGDPRASHWVRCRKPQEDEDSVI